MAKEVMKLNVITNVYTFYPEDYSEETMVQMKLHTDQHLLDGA